MSKGYMDVAIAPIFDMEDYNENLIWLEHDMAHVDFHVRGILKLIAKRPPVMDMEYFIVFGELEGYIRDENGKKYVLDGMIGIGEDKSLTINI